MIQGAKKRVGFIAGKVAMFSAHEYLMTCPHGELRVGVQKTPRFLQTLSCNAAPRITKNCITGKTLGGTLYLITTLG